MNREDRSSDLTGIERDLLVQLIVALRFRLHLPKNSDTLTCPVCRVSVKITPRSTVTMLVRDGNGQRYVKERGTKYQCPRCPGLWFRLSKTEFPLVLRGPTSSAKTGGGRGTRTAAPAPFDRDALFREVKRRRRHGIFYIPE